MEEHAQRKSMSYVELHGHSNFSLLDGACFPEQLVEGAANRGMKAIALTDHDGLYGMPQFFRTARNTGIRAIAGAELTLEHDRHITLLVKNQKGYGNLSRLITRAQLSGGKGNPHLDFASIAELSEGLVCLSGCRKGEIPGLLLQGKKDDAEKTARGYMEVFPRGSFFVELQHHFEREDTRLCRRLADLAAAVGAPLVVTNNVHYTERTGHRLHDVLVCIKNRVGLDESSPFRRSNSEYYLKSYDEMLLLPGLPRGALRQALAIAEMCDFTLDFSSYSFPDFALPPGETAPSYLRRLCEERIPQKYREGSAEVWQRLGEELSLIERKGLCGYFLIVWDIMDFALKNGILAQGRGSAASSLVAYVLGITPVDPIRHGLFVGRFLNESSAVPDIDIDIGTERREEVIRYVYEKYGEEHAAMVCTYVTFRARNAIREVGKVFGFPPHVLDRMAKSSCAYSPAHVIEELRDVPEFRHYLDSAAWGHFCALSTQIADFPRHLSIHVGGMIVSSKRISEMVPLERARAEGRVVCQWDKDGVDDAGLIKVDLLGLRMLSLIDEAVRLVRSSRGVDLDLTALPEDDPLVYDMIGRADTVGVFQVESRAQMQSLPRVRPRSLEDLGIEVAIIRPGPLQGHMVHPYMRRRNREEPVVYLHPLLEPILRETLGVILFQEQILQVAMAIAGFTAGQANGLRKAMGRKHGMVEMEKWGAAFIEGAAGKNIERVRAMKIFDLLCGFAEFGFCKSHAMSFALLCYRSAFLKLYYPAEFYCALLNNQPMGFYVPEVILGDARRHGVMILPIDVNESVWNCTVERPTHGAPADPTSDLAIPDPHSDPAVDAGCPGLMIRDLRIRLGFRYVKSLGEEGAGRIAAERERASFISFKDFCFRTSLERDALRNLVVIGAFDRLERSRRQLLWMLRTLRIGGPQGIDLAAVERAPLDEMSHREELLSAYSVQGFSASSHLLDLYRDKLKQSGAVMSSQLAGLPSGAAIKAGGYNVCLQMPPTAKGFAFVTLEDEEGLMNVVLKPDVYRTYRMLVRLEPLLFVEGVLEKKDGVINVVSKKVAPLRQL